jgi:hypothetical protein
MYIEDPQLGPWANKQLRSFRKGELHPEQKRMPNEIGFVFNRKGMTYEDIWSLQFKKLRGYYGKHGHCKWFSVLDHSIFFLNTPLTPNLPVSLNCSQCAADFEGRPISGQLGPLSA